MSDSPSEIRSFWLASLVMAVLAAIPLALIISDPGTVAVAWVIVIANYAALILMFDRSFALEAIIMTTILAVVISLSMIAYRTYQRRRATSAGTPVAAIPAGGAARSPEVRLPWRGRAASAPAPAGKGGRGEWREIW